MKKSLLIAPLFLFTACAKQLEPKIINEIALSELDSKIIQVTAHTPQGFRAETTGKAMLASFLLGGAGASLAESWHYNKGAELISTYSLKDPSIAVAERITNVLQAQYNNEVLNLDGLRMFTKENPNHNELFNNAEQMVEFYNEGDVLLDVDTRFWGLNTTGVNNVWYKAQIRLIDAYTQQDLAADTCEYKSSAIESGSTPTYNELVHNNNAKLLKTYLNNAAEYCAKKFITNNLTIHY